MNELRAAIRQYDDALRRREVAALEEFWAPDYIFVDRQQAASQMSPVAAP